MSRIVSARPQITKYPLFFLGSDIKPEIPEACSELTVSGAVRQRREHLSVFLSLKRTKLPGCAESSPADICHCTPALQEMNTCQISVRDGYPPP
ncbi:hypothetical protein CesoFtcFv8_019478 [Champsocephalus esox]|nr:hypothetical protein CesoFtcFv8_019478 [Champsocephalus esox]